MVDTKHLYPNGPNKGGVNGRLRSSFRSRLRFSNRGVYAAKSFKH
jgi:hypothetical protein